MVPDKLSTSIPSSFYVLKINLYEEKAADSRVKKIQALVFRFFAPSFPLTNDKTKFAASVHNVLKRCIDSRSQSSSKKRHFL